MNLWGVITIVNESVVSYYNIVNESVAVITIVNEPVAVITTL